MYFLFILTLLYVTPACQSQCVSCYPQPQYQTPCCSQPAANVQTIQSASAFTNGNTGSQVVMYYNGQRIVAGQPTQVATGYNQNQNGPTNYQNPGVVPPSNTGYYQNSNQTGFYPYPSTLSPSTGVLQQQQQQQNIGGGVNVNTATTIPVGGNINNGNQQQIVTGGTVASGQSQQQIGNGASPTQNSQYDSYNDNSNTNAGYVPITPSTNEVGYQPFVPSGNTGYNANNAAQGQSNTGGQTVIYPPSSGVVAGSAVGGGNAAGASSSSYNSPNTGYIDSNSQVQTYPTQIVAGSAVTPQNVQQQQQQNYYDQQQQPQQGYNPSSESQNPSSQHIIVPLNDQNSTTTTTSPEMMDDSLGQTSPIIPVIYPNNNVQTTQTTHQVFDNTTPTTTTIHVENDNTGATDVTSNPTTPVIFPVQNNFDTTPTPYSSIEPTTETPDEAETSTESVTGSYQQSSSGPYIVGQGVQGQQTSTTNGNQYQYQPVQSTTPNYGNQYTGQQFDQTSGSTGSMDTTNTMNNQLGSSTTSSFPQANYPSQQEILAAQGQSTSGNVATSFSTTPTPQYNPQQQYLDGSSTSSSSIPTSTPYENQQQQQQQFTDMNTQGSTIPVSSTQSIPTPSYPSQAELQQQQQQTTQQTFQPSAAYDSVMSSTQSTVAAQYPSQQEILERTSQGSGNQNIQNDAVTGAFNNGGQDASSTSGMTPVYGDLNTQYGHYESSTNGATTQFGSNPQFDQQQSSSGQILNLLILGVSLIYVLI